MLMLYYYFDHEQRNIVHKKFLVILNENLATLNALLFHPTPIVVKYMYAISRFDSYFYYS